MHLQVGNSLEFGRKGTIAQPSLKGTMINAIYSAWWQWETAWFRVVEEEQHWEMKLGYISLWVQLDAQGMNVHEQC